MFLQWLQDMQERTVSIKTQPVEITLPILFQFWWSQRATFSPVVRAMQMTARKRLCAKGATTSCEKPTEIIHNYYSKIYGEH